MLADMLRLGNDQVPKSKDTLFVALEMSGEEGFDTTVPRRLVHREAVAEVLLTRWTRRRTGDFWMCAQLPRSHAFYQSEQGRADPLLVLETIRQAGLLVAHTGWGIPLDHRFVMRGMSFAVDSSALRVRDRPVEIQLLVRTRDPRVRPGHTSTLAVEVELYRDGDRFGQGSGSLGALPPAVYARLRPPRVPRQPVRERPEPVPPWLVGRHDARDVLLTSVNKSNRWGLLVDATHQGLFDHPVDHVPGMVVFAAMSQAVRAVVGPGYLASCQARTSRFVELDRPAEVSVLRTAGGLYWTAIEQDGVRAATAVWRVETGSGHSGPVS
ncbi:ScbA/BarX family gamma-butyrolactone biosynthesis protein [Crossiella cryophila]|uniref:ScbA/BarX family gamma-butyrolactone biosynthesis protein n=1 Tax=Crossiella cryophila TaxID=43355 RepID=UPI0028A9BB0E|nr:ScbA/BarX family gamma-butyrolactone biosynthesis protein [Crossiella cryophila]